jgi:hypothetical protein
MSRARRRKICDRRRGLRGFVMPSGEIGVEHTDKDRPIPAIRRGLDGSDVQRGQRREHEGGRDPGKQARTQSDNDTTRA